jgi:hypothetical protein
MGDLLIPLLVWLTANLHVLTTLYQTASWPRVKR